METREVYEKRRAAVVARIKADPNSFSMDMWMTRPLNEFPGGCDTVACLAGHTILEMGLLSQVLWERRESENVWVAARLKGGTEQAGWFDHIAAEYLGMSEGKASLLFCDFSLETAEQVESAMARVPFITDIE